MLFTHIYHVDSADKILMLKMLVKWMISKLI